MTTTGTAPINLDEVQTGDELLIRHDRNRIAVTAVRGADKITATAFNTDVVMGTRSATRQVEARLARAGDGGWGPSRRC